MLLRFIALCAFCIPETISLRKSVYYKEATEEDSTAKTAAKNRRGAVYVGYSKITSSMATLFGHDKKLAIILLNVPVLKI